MASKVPGGADDAARQDVALHLAGGVLLQQVAPFLLGDAQRVRGRQPARHGEDGLGSGGAGQERRPWPPGTTANVSSKILLGWAGDCKSSGELDGPDLPGFSDRRVGELFNASAREGRRGPRQGSAGSIIKKNDRSFLFLFCETRPGEWRGAAPHRIPVYVNVNSTSYPTTLGSRKHEGPGTGQTRGRLQREGSRQVGQQRASTSPTSR